jgi:hypothetical protein
MSEVDGNARGARGASGLALGETGMGIGAEVLGTRLVGVDAPEAEGVRVSEARSGSSSDFFLWRRDGCTERGTPRDGD